MAQTKVPYTITPRAISIVVGSRPKLIDASNVNYSALAVELRKPVHDFELIKELADLNTFIAKVTFGQVQISEGQVRWKGAEIKNVIADRLMEMCRLGYDLEPLSMFTNRLMENPLESTRDELYQWLEAGSAPITSEGNFLAYKAVRNDYKDKHTGSMDNSVGNVLQMERSACDTNRNNECSRGLHFCQYGYLSQFAHGDDRIMIVEIDPADVVAIPKDHNRQKGRTWRYKVVGEIGGVDVADIFVGRPLVDDYSALVNDNGMPETDDADADEIEGSGDTYDFTAGLPSEATTIASFNNAVSKEIVTAEEPEHLTRQDKTFIAAAETPRAMDTDQALLQLAHTMLEFTLPSGKTITAEELSKTVAEKGQRGAAKLLNAGRSTMQGWLKKIAKNG